jgi:hypothetical protein
MTEFVQTLQVFLVIRQPSEKITENSPSICHRLQYGEPNQQSSQVVSVQYGVYHDNNIHDVVESCHIKYGRQVPQLRAGRTAEYHKQGRS